MSADERALSERFAREADDDISDLRVTELATGSPVLVECLAALDCETEAIHKAGDHLIVIGRIKALGLPRAAEPLIYFRRRYRRLNP